MTKRAYYFSFLFILVALSCSKVDTSAIDNLQQGKIIRIGHGGSGFTSLIPFNPLPSNSISGLKKALEENHADGVEIDVHMTADFDFIVYHDKNLETKTAKKAYPEELELKDIVGTPYQVGFPYDLFQDESIVSLDSVITYVKTLPEFPILQLDIRHSCDCFSAEENEIWGETMFKKLFQKLDELNVPKEKVQLITVSKPLTLFGKKQPNAYSISFEVPSFEDGLNWAIENEVDCITVRRKILDAEKAKLAHKNGIKVITFHAKSKSGNKGLIEKNPDYIQTDNLSALNDLLGE